MAVALCAAWAAPALGAGTELPEALSDRELVGMAFFIVVGVIQASRDPASSRADTAWASTSPVASSMLASSRTTG